MGAGFPGKLVSIMEQMETIVNNPFIEENF